MKKVTREEWARLQAHGYTGQWTQGVWEFRGRDFPEDWIGRRTMTTYEDGLGTVLLTEGVSFEVND